MIKVSKQKPMLPETFIPWDYKDTGEETYLPDRLISIAGTKYYDQLSIDDKKLLGKHELTQVMFIYAWSETLACALFNNRLMTLDEHDIEYRFLIRELIEEYRHQSMFCDAIDRIGGKPKPIKKRYKWFARVNLKFTPESILFFSVLAVELATDIYGDILRKEPGIHPVIQKVSKLHHIEESRHILYAQLWLKHHTENTGIIKRSIFTMTIIFILVYVRSMYTDEKIFDEMGFDNPKKVYKKAKKNLAIKYGKYCMKDTIEYISSYNGWNRFTKYMSNKLLKTDL